MARITNLVGRRELFAPNLTLWVSKWSGKLVVMKIVVCVKHVPDADSDRRIESGRIVRGEDDVLNELDEYAIEEAVTLVEDRGGEVIALTMGPEDSEEAVLRALQMGADRGLVVSDPALEGADAPATADVLAAAVRMIGADDPVDLVLTGMASLDGMTSMLAPALAATLDWPLLDLAQTVQVEDTDQDGAWKVTVTRNADGFEDTLSATTPLVVSVTDQINEPRYPSFKTMRAAKQKPLDFVELVDLEVGRSFDEGSALTVVIDAQPVVREGGVVVTDSGDGGTQLAEYLLENIPGGVGGLPGGEA